mmetsp:Transcript_167509/g.537921  ORF Transcript_167509/g.537921 Transcript_167509/m.537921 type:complete len:283 (+) Transcript_167509:1081-1929(+)
MLLLRGLDATTNPRRRSALGEAAGYDTLRPIAACAAVADASDLHGVHRRPGQLAWGGQRLTDGRGGRREEGRGVACSVGAASAVAHRTSGGELGHLAALCDDDRGRPTGTRLPDWGSGLPLVHHRPALARLQRQLMERHRRRGQGRRGSYHRRGGLRSILAAIACGQHCGRRRRHGGAGTRAPGRADEAAVAADRRGRHCCGDDRHLAVREDVGLFAKDAEPEAPGRGRQRRAGQRRADHGPLQGELAELALRQAWAQRRELRGHWRGGQEHREVAQRLALR